MQVNALPRLKTRFGLNGVTGLTSVICPTVMPLVVRVAESWKVKKGDPEYTKLDAGSVMLPYKYILPVPAKVIT